MAAIMARPLSRRTWAAIASELGVAAADVEAGIVACRDKRTPAHELRLAFEADQRPRPRRARHDQELDRDGAAQAPSDTPLGVLSFTAAA